MLNVVGTRSLSTADVIVCSECTVLIDLKFRVASNQEHKRRCSEDRWAMRRFFLFPSIRLDKDKKSLLTKAE